jgi:hypothetical protein
MQWQYSSFVVVMTGSPSELADCFHGAALECHLNTMLFSLGY